MARRRKYNPPNIGGTITDVGGDAKHPGRGGGGGGSNYTPPDVGSTITGAGATATTAGGGGSPVAATTAGVTTVSQGVEHVAAPTPTYAPSTSSATTTVDLKPLISSIADPAIRSLASSAIRQGIRYEVNPSLLLAAVGSATDYGREGSGKGYANLGDGSEDGAKSIEQVAKYLSAAGFHKDPEGALKALGNAQGVASGDLHSNYVQRVKSTASGYTELDQAARKVETAEGDTHAGGVGKFKYRSPEQRPSARVAEAIGQVGGTGQVRATGEAVFAEPREPVRARKAVGDALTVDPRRKELMESAGFTPASWPTFAEAGRSTRRTPYTEAEQNMADRRLKELWKAAKGVSGLTGPAPTAALDSPAIRRTNKEHNLSEGAGEGRSLAGVTGKSRVLFGPAASRALLAKDWDTNEDAKGTVLHEFAHLRQEGRAGEDQAEGSAEKFRLAVAKKLGIKQDRGLLAPSYLRQLRDTKGGKQFALYKQFGKPSPKDLKQNAKVAKGIVQRVVNMVGPSDQDKRRIANNLVKAVSKQDVEIEGLQPAQAEFAAELAKETGLSPRVVAAWVLQEGGNGGANHNWLNIGAFDSGFDQGIMGDPRFQDPISAAQVTADFLRGKEFGASEGIQNILPQAQGASDQAQINAITNSGWAGDPAYTENVTRNYGSVSVDPGKPLNKALVKRATQTIGKPATKAILKGGTLIPLSKKQMRGFGNETPQEAKKSGGPAGTGLIGFAEKQLGTQEGTAKQLRWAAENYGASTDPWCSIFVAAGLRAQGVKDIPTNAPDSSTWLNWSGGKPVDVGSAKPGDIVVFDWGDGGTTDHVAIYSGNGNVIGGNQSDAVTEVPMQADAVVGVIRPKGNVSGAAGSNIVQVEGTNLGVKVPTPAAVSAPAADAGIATGAAALTAATAAASGGAPEPIPTGPVGSLPASAAASYARSNLQPASLDAATTEDPLVAAFRPNRRR